MPRRRVDNLLGLAVLAALAERPMHRYELTAVIRERGKERDLAVKVGSLYTVVQNLARHGLVESTGTDRDGARPERTTYAITAAGRAELADWTRELIGTPRPEQTAFVAGLSVAAGLPPDEVARLLRSRLRQLQATAASRRAELTANLTGVRRLFLIEDEYALAQLESEVRWVRGLLDELEDGSFADLEQWRGWTGEEAR